MTNNRQVLQTLRNERQKINKEIAVIKEQLDRIDRGDLSPNALYITLKKVKDVKDLASPHRNLKHALLNDLAMLGYQLK